MAILVRSAVLAGFDLLAGELGLDALGLLRTVGLPARSLRQPDLPIAAGKAYRLLELAASISGAADFGLRLSARRSRLSSLGALGALIRDEPDVRHALQQLADNLHLHSTCLAMRLHESRGVAVIRLEVLPDGEPVLRQATESALGALCHMLRGFLGPGWRPAQVLFVHRCAGSDRPHRRLFGCPVLFGQDRNALVTTSAQLDQPVPLADGRLRRYAGPAAGWPAAGAAPASAADRVEPLIAARLPEGGCTSEAVASALGISRRSLNRRLAAQGETFSAVLVRARLALAGQYLAGGTLSMTEIAALLGFASPSAFSRWHRVHAGVAPSRWRGAR